MMIRTVLLYLLWINIEFIISGTAQQPPPSDGDSSRPKVGQRSLVIVFDTTGSMGSDLEQVRREAKAIVEYAAAQPANPFYNFIFVDFNDPDVGTALVTTSKDVLLNKLQRITVNGGGDCPELAMEGIKRALEKALYKSQIFVFTDADAKDIHLENDVKRLIQEKQATITFFITLGYCMSVGGAPIYKNLTKISGGQAYYLTKNDISKVLQVTRETLDIHRDLVYVEDFRNEKKETYVVSENTKDITVAVTGLKPRVSFTDPDNKKVNVKPQVDLDNVQIYQINNPKSGPWIIDTKVSDAGRLQVTQVSPLNFEFGFSVSKPKTIKETFVRPLKGINNYLVIAPINMPAGSTFNYVTFTTDTATKRYNLREFAPGLYITDSFLQPDLFKVAIHGKDVKGNEIKRLISTSIQPEIESKPSITIIEHELTVLQYGELMLKCTAKSFSPMTLKWTKTGAVLREVLASQSYELEHTIPMVSLESKGDYFCQASNRMGNTESKITVTVAPRALPLPQVTVHPEAKGVREDGNIRIKCMIKYPYDTTYWTFKRNSIGTETRNSEISLTKDYVEADRTLTIPFVTANHAGTYTCVAKVNETEVKGSVYIEVGYEAEITDSIKETLVTSAGNSVKLTCHAKGSPPPNIEWFFVDNDNQRRKLSYAADTVIIDNLNFTSDGNYECEVFNGVGETKRRTIQLKVEALKIPIIRNGTDVLIVVRTNETRSLICECEHCLPMRSHAWTFNDIPIDETNLENVHLNYSSSNTDRFQTTLTLDHVVQKNEGIYKCALENDLNSGSHEIVVNVLKKPEIQRISASNSKIVRDGEVIVHEQQSIVLNCQLHVDLDPTFSWFKDGLHISSERYLKLDFVTYNDTGLYRCLVNNSEGSSAKTLMVQVYGQPMIVSNFTDSFIKLTGVELKVECNVTGFPLPQVRWVDEYEQLITTSNGVLKLKDYTNNYSTKFICFAESSVGSVNATINVRYQQNLMVPNKAIQLLCPFLVTDIVHWYKDNVEIEKSSPLFFITKDIMQFAKPVAHNYSGLYRCEIGRQEFHFNLIILSPPVIEAIEVTVDKIVTPLKNDEITVRVGQEVTVRCLVKGHPRPTVYWRTKRRYLDGGEILHLPSVEKQNEGIYNCFAKLERTGKDKKQISLRVMV